MLGYFPRRVAVVRGTSIHYQLLMPWLIDQISARRRIAALSIPSLLERCRMTLVGYVADESLRGNLPFPRSVACVFVPRISLTHMEPKGTRRRAALCPQEAPCAQAMAWNVVGCVVRFAVEICLRTTWFVPSFLLMLEISLIIDPAIDQTLTPSALISDAVKRSTKAHLFHFYPILCEIVAIPRKPPTAWIMTGGHRMSAESRNTSGEDASDGHAVELDARTLVKDCLKEVGRELGVGH